MTIGKMLLVIEVALTVVKVLLGRHCWIIAVEAFVRLTTVVLISAVAA
jgi:hypothetical protein